MWPCFTPSVEKFYFPRLMNCILKKLFRYACWQFFTTENDLLACAVCKLFLKFRGWFHFGFNKESVSPFEIPFLSVRAEISWSAKRIIKPLFSPTNHKLTVFIQYRSRQGLFELWLTPASVIEPFFFYFPIFLLNYGRTWPAVGMTPLQPGNY